MKKRDIKRSKSRFHYPKQVVLGIIDAGLVMLIAGIFFMAWIYYSATPAASQLVTRKIAQTSTIYDRSGENILYELHGEENRKIIKHDEIPDFIRIATIATEDANFYRHVGVDPFAIMRALKVNLQNNGVRQGGSTITQQLARGAFLTPERTMKRKFLEAIFALKIERHYSKAEILDQYLNQVPYGANAYGVQAASETYFGKNAKDLTLDEAAFLAALPKAPSYYSPYNVHHDELKERQKIILERIGYLKLASSDEVKNALVVDTLKKVRDHIQPIRAPHFVFFVLEQLEKKYGKEFIETGGLKIKTSLNYEMQTIGEEIVLRGAERNIARGATNAALVAIDPKNGDILAMVGSKNYFDSTIDGQVNIATSQRQPGSSFKPFAYAHAFELGYQPETKILDAQTNFGPDGSGRSYVPRNYDGKFHGLLTMRESLSQSLNVPAVKTLYLASIDGTIELAHRMGITTLNDRKRYGLSLVLGGGEVKLLDMTSAFSVFAAEGMRSPARSVIKIVDHSGKILEESKNEPQQVLDVQVARKINSILSDNVARTPIFGPRSSLILDDGRVVAAKTGTTQEFRDAWTVGYTPSIAVGVWAGNNNNRPMKAGADGVFVAAPIWKEYMQKILIDQPKETFIAYNTFKQDKPVQIAGQANMQAVVTYYRKSSGKKISAERAAKADPTRIKQKIEYVPVVDGQVNVPKNSFSVAMPSPADPMYQRWVGQIQDTNKTQKK